MTKKDLDEIIKHKVRESNSLEFKRADSLYNLLKKEDGKISEFTKDITAIANSNGGIIIYGIEEFTKGNNKSRAKSFNPIDRDRVSIEWLEQIMNSRIQPRIQKYKMYEIDINENQFILAIDIQQSDTIHQGNDKRYYRRFEFQSVMMDDFEIKSLINRFNKPVIQEKIYIQKKPDYLIKAFNHIRIYDYELIIAVENVGNIMAKYLSCHVRIAKDAFQYINFESIEKSSYSDYFEMEFNNRQVRRIELDNKKQEIGSDYIPILPNSWRRLKIIPITKEFFEKNIEINVFVSTESTFSEKKYFSDKLTVEN